jgi:peptidoglycan hydrolase CwlO-like protein
MKQIILLFIIVAGILPVSAQKVKVEARDGKTVIIRKDTTGNETREISEWKENPRSVLQTELNEAEKYLSWLDEKINNLQTERKAKRQEQKDLQKAIADLDAGILIETGIPGAKVAPAPTPEQTPIKPTKKKTTKKTKKH